MHMIKKTITFVAIAFIAIIIAVPSTNGEVATAKKQYMGYGGMGYGIGYGGAGYVTPGYGAYGNPGLGGGVYGSHYGGLVPPYPGNYGAYGDFSIQQPYPSVYPSVYQPNYGMYQQPAGGYYPGYQGYSGYPGMGDGMISYSAKKQPAHRENA